MIQIKEGIKKIVLIYSGGLDSTVLLYYLLDKGYEVLPLHFVYGCNHGGKETRAAFDICVEKRIKMQGRDLTNVFSGFDSSLLTGGKDIPEGHYEDDNMKSTVVPFRNGILLSVATGYAENIKYDAVAYAAHGGDHAIYPDCRPVFEIWMGRAMKTGTYNSIQLLTPFMTWDKGRIVQLGDELRVPFEYTWTCYKGEDMHCGKCGACVERKEAFIKSNVFDPTSYKE